ncbi:MAG: thioredoxin-dependent thiol peroxidase [Erysipelotrichaceae bacterium]
MFVNEPAFDFTLLDHEGHTVHLHDFIGEHVVVYFYPKDNTPGCSEQACNYRDHFEAFQKRGVAVIGISKDSQKSHQNFRTKYNLNFPLLSDPDLQAIEAYGVWKEKKLYGKTYMGVERTTFVISPTGVILGRFEKVSPKDDPETILRFLDEQMNK